MRHRVKKIKIRAGKDANKMLARKLVVNFLSHGRIETTMAKAKMVKPLIDEVASKAKNIEKHPKASLIRFFGNERFVNGRVSEIGKALKNVSGGFVRLVKLQPRSSDGAQMARIEWVTPVVLEKKEEPKRTPPSKQTETKKMTQKTK